MHKTTDMSRMSSSAADRLASCLHRTVLTGHRAFSSHARPHNYTSRSYSSMCQAASTASSTQLWQQVTTTYSRARELGAAKTTDSIVELYTDQRNGVEYVLRILANLAEKKATKPKLDSKSASPPKDFRNPFLPYEEDLWVQHLSDTHTLLLNKFNLVAHHVLVVTRQFESQQDPLNANDFAATWQVLQAMPNGGLAFYNCGPLSGRSQPHKHVQVVPLPLIDPQPNAPPLQVAIDAATRWQQPPAADNNKTSPLPIYELRTMPFAAFYVNLPADVQPQQLEAAGAALLQRCRQHAGQPEVSYNVLLSSSFLMYVPRGAEGCGPVDCNALGFAGTMLVRSRPELQFIKDMGPTEYLAAVGLPW